MTSRLKVYQNAQTFTLTFLLTASTELWGTNWRNGGPPADAHLPGSSAALTSLYDVVDPVSRYNMFALRLSRAAAVCSTGSRVPQISFSHSEGVMWRADAKWTSRSFYRNLLDGFIYRGGEGRGLRSTCLIPESTPILRSVFTLPTSSTGLLKALCCPDNHYFYMVDVFKIKMTNLELLEFFWNFPEKQTLLNWLSIIFAIAVNTFQTHSRCKLNLMEPRILTDELCAWGG